jgi:hypothetical protein
MEGKIVLARSVATLRSSHSSSQVRPNHFVTPGTRKFGLKSYPGLTGGTFALLPDIDVPPQAAALLAQIPPADLAGDQLTASLIFPFPLSYAAAFDRAASLSRRLRRPPTAGRTSSLPSSRQPPPLFLLGCCISLPRRMVSGWTRWAVSSKAIYGPHLFYQHRLDVQR